MPSSPHLIPLSEPLIGGNAWTYVKECLDSGWVSSAGMFVTRFEEMAAARVRVEHAVATSSGTAALHIALLTAGIQPGDEVVVPTLTFIAPANAVRYVGAFPVFVDVEPRYWQLDPQLLDDFLVKQCDWVGGALRNRATGRRIAAVVPVDLLGHPVDLDPIIETARRFELTVVEDATESLGASYKGEPVGSKADIACLSFNGNKIVTSGGGGMIVTDSAAYADRARYLTTQAKDDALEYVHHSIGYNYRLTNLQAALGVAQLEQLDDHVRAKLAIAERYRAGLQDAAGIRTMREAPWASSTFWLYTVLVDAGRYGRDSRALLAGLWDRLIQTRPLWQPLHRSPAHAGAQVVGGEVADTIASQALSLPSSVGLSEADQLRVIDGVRALAASSVTRPPVVH